MKPHEPIKRYKIRAKKKRITKGYKKPNQKREKDTKTLSQKNEEGVGKKT
jgi:hypothetical protein